MRKDSTKRRAHRIRRARKAARHQERRHWSRELYRDSQRALSRWLRENAPITRSVAARHHHETVRLEGVLCLASRPGPTLKELLKLDLQLPSCPTLVVVDLRGVKAIDAAAIVYLCSRIRRIGRRPHTQVAGFYPVADAPTRLLMEAGFDDFLKSEQVPRRATGDFRSVKLVVGRRRNERVNPDVAAEVGGFIKALQPSMSVIEHDSLTLAVSECLENVRVHAYRPRIEYGWYVVGVHDPDRRVSSVAILDAGRGIFASSTENAPLSDTKGNRKVALLETTKGVRTASMSPERGKGLSSLREMVCDPTCGGSFTVVSSGAMVRWVTGDEPDRIVTVPDVGGTIVVVEVPDP